MIGRLNGILALKKAPLIMIDCNGVWYDVEVSMTTYYQLPEVNEKASVWTHLQIKDDQHSLIGFFTEQERQLFRQLIKINGVGVKMALTILSGMSGSELSACVSSNDVMTLTRLPGVGKKTAERLIIELRDKLDGFADVSIELVAGSEAAIASNSVAEAIEALQTLGYKPVDATKMVKAVAKPEHNAETIIKMALQAVVRK
ncbi:MAG: Holliday junction branch migration protein RuvA [Gammaproteobacteria bacterium]|nr:Holliday junction branch migration protein RuvA [Gammaproteobacteria bacterium]